MKDTVDCRCPECKKTTRHEVTDRVKHKVKCLICKHEHELT
jgi:hypothetical protein